MVNDSALLGTVFALFPEAILNGEKAEAAWYKVQSALEEGWNLPGLNQIQFDSYEQCLKLLGEGCRLWLVEVLHKIPRGSEPEVRFSYDLIPSHKPGGKRIITLEGTSDLWLPNGEIWDWKLSGREYDKAHAWKFSRYDPQPPHYVLARSLGNNATALKRKFTYVNMRRDDTKKMQREPIVDWLEVKLTLADMQWHMHRLNVMCDYIETNGFDKPWHINPTDWWCSPRWCPSWNDCRGKVMDDPDPWNMLGPK